MEDLLDIGVTILRLVPMILAFYIPALIGTVIWSERGEGYVVKALLWFLLGFGALAAMHVVFTGASGLEAAAILGLSLFQILVALGLAALTVYKLSDRATS
jgi:tryptophan-rich sensory protein